jgi:hypothetical protein
LTVIGAILIGLVVIGLAGAMVIAHQEVSNNSKIIIGRDSGRVSKIPENINGYYQGGDRGGILDMIRMGRRSPRALDGIQKGGLDRPGLAGALERNREILYTDCQ